LTRTPLSRVSRGVALVLLALAMATVRVVWSSRVEWKAAAAAEGEQRIAHLGRAARLYAPGNPYSRRGLDELVALGRAGGPTELSAWRAARSAVLATRSFYTPRREVLDEANARIAQLMAAAEPDSRGPVAARQAWHADRLAQDDAPSVGWSLVALLGLAAWVGSAVGFFLRAVDEQDRLRRRPAVTWALGIAAGLTLFFLGLARA
jgi:hypothetical protein